MATTKYIVDNVSGQTITGDLTINGNFTITGTTNTRPYKVYTALLTQSGENNQSQLTGGTLTIGVTYWITDDSGNPDWTNVGAPNNMENTYFVATGTNPNSWGNNGASLNYNTGAPVVTVLENTIGDIWFTYDFVGQYVLKGPFLELIDASKIFIQIGKPNTSFAGVAGYVDIFQVEAPNMYIMTKDFDNNSSSNGVLSITPIEIRVYN